MGILNKKVLGSVFVGVGGCLTFYALYAMQRVSAVKVSFLKDPLWNPFVYFFPPSKTMQSNQALLIYLIAGIALVIIGVGVLLLNKKRLASFQHHTHHAKGKKKRKR